MYFCISNCDSDNHFEPVMFAQTSNEPLHDKAPKISVSPAKTQIDLGIHPDQSELSLCFALMGNKRPKLTS